MKKILKCLGHWIFIALTFLLSTNKYVTVGRINYSFHHAHKIYNWRLKIIWVISLATVMSSEKTFFNANFYRFLIFLLIVSFIIKSIAIICVNRLLYINLKLLSFLKYIRYCFFISPPLLLSSNKSVITFLFQMENITFSPLSVSTRKHFVDVLKCQSFLFWNTFKTLLFYFSKLLEKCTF